jgi:predicted metal-dependent HD superfamily phosphohydrolase
MISKHQLQLVSEAKKIATRILQNDLSPSFVFHNLDHTQQVVDAAEEIGGHYRLSDTEKLVLFISAWFHDTGYSCGQAEGHENESIRLAAGFLDDQHAGKNLIAQVSSCIRATHLPQVSQNLVEKIICDADLYHLGSYRFGKMNCLLKQELQDYYQTNFTDHEWRQRSIEFLNSHSYFTGYCREKLEHVKQRWLELMQEQNSKLKIQNPKLIAQN